jgi:DnaJ-class molecular chaperone
VGHWYCVYNTESCSHCYGSGTRNDEECYCCEGKGEIKVKEYHYFEPEKEGYEEV